MCITESQIVPEEAIDAIVADLAERRPAPENPGVPASALRRLVESSLRHESRRARAATGIEPSSLWIIVAVRRGPRLVTLRYLVDSDGHAWRSDPDEGSRFEQLEPPAA